MAEDDPDARRLAELEERLKKARGPAEVPREEASPSQLGIAFRLVTELLAAVIVGGAIGWALDRVLGTSPFLLIVMFLFGVAAGMRNLMRTAREMNESQALPIAEGRPLTKERIDSPMSSPATCSNNVSLKVKKSDT